jgi:hypothetical protein
MCIIINLKLNTILFTFLVYSFPIPIIFTITPLSRILMRTSLSLITLLASLQLKIPNLVGYIPEARSSNAGVLWHHVDSGRPSVNSSCKIITMALWHLAKVFPDKISDAHGSRLYLARSRRHTITPTKAKRLKPAFLFFELSTIRSSRCYW